MQRQQCLQDVNFLSIRFQIVRYVICFQIWSSSSEAGFYMISFTKRSQHRLVLKTFYVCQHMQLINVFKFCCNASGIQIVV